MPEKKPNDSTENFDLKHFEKNRYFDGKLTTAFDMQVEQQYHTDRLETVTKLTNGTGIVYGLEISDFTQEGEELHITIEPGMAIDDTGRPIVVRNPTTRTVQTPRGEKVFVYLEYDSEKKDPVPIPGKEPVSEDDAEESRILEVFEITARETSPARYKSPSEIDVSDLVSSDETLEEMADELADTYHREHREEFDGPSDPGVFLGAYAQTPDEKWTVAEETVRRPYQYDSDMLFSVLISHIADTENPHKTRIGEPTEYIESELDQIEGVSMRLQQLRTDMKELNEKLESHTEYTTHKSLKTSIRFFDDLAATFEEESEISRAALRIVNSARDAIQSGLYEDADSYVSFVHDLTEDVQDLADAIEGATTETNYQQFVSVVEELESVTEEETTVIEVARTLDKVGEAADMLETRTEVIPEDSE